MNRNITVMCFLMDKESVREECVICCEKKPRKLVKTTCCKKIIHSHCLSNWYYACLGSACLDSDDDENNPDVQKIIGFNCPFCRSVYKDICFLCFKIMKVKQRGVFRAFMGCCNKEIHTKCIIKYNDFIEDNNLHRKNVKCFCKRIKI